VMLASPACIVVSECTSPHRLLPVCTFIPKYYVFPFRPCFISRSRASAVFFIELARGVDRYPALRQQAVLLE